MIIPSLFFYVFAGVCIASAVMVISTKNPVHSVLFLILAFVNAAGLFVLMGAEFLAMILIVVYVGAVAVLFLFVVMMLDINFVELRQGFLQYLPIGALIGLILLAELILMFGAWVAAEGRGRARFVDRGAKGRQNRIRLAGTRNHHGENRRTQKCRDCQRVGMRRHVSGSLEAAVAHLLGSTGLVEADDLHQHRIEEVGDGRIVERQVSIRSNPAAHHVNRRLRQPRRIFPR